LINIYRIVTSKTSVNHWGKKVNTGVTML